MAISDDREASNAVERGPTAADARKTARAARRDKKQQAAADATSSQRGGGMRPMAAGCDQRTAGLKSATTKRFSRVKFAATAGYGPRRPTDGGPGCVGRGDGCGGGHGESEKKMQSV
ncbi:hypothetical protein Scep_006309 [Stephania cephalantha]|uniref:Uncharacterized protein n=1 Tax=Stephania cephalantha TaxID=152367 RepID=A0AAP0K7Y5_9MAGN